MSRTGKLPIPVPAAVKIDLAKDNITVKGPKGELKTRITGDVNVTFDQGKILVQPANDSIRSRTMWGTTRANINNMVQGVSEGYTKRMELQGVGFRAEVAKGFLSMTIGLSHEVKYFIPAGIAIKVEKQTLLEITGFDKQLVGQVAAEIHSLKKPEPYKGKGIRYVGQFVRRKEGKKK